MKRIPVLFEKKELCCGCAACMAVCSQNAISMQKDEEGFEYPIIASDKCVGCLKCLEVCPVKRKEDNYKIGIVTLYGNNNIGNKLQNFAVQEILRKRGYDVRTIIGELEEDDDKSKIIKIKRFLIRIFISLGWESRRLKKYALDLKRTRKFEEFSEKYLILGERINIAEISKFPEERYDYFIVGSDQVWHNWTGQREELDYYFLRFTEKNKRLCIAPSFGLDAVPDAEKEIFKEGLEGFLFLSCREESGVSLIKKLTDRTAALLIDPTMMLTSKAWQEISRKPVFVNDNEKYLLVYLLGNDVRNTKSEIQRIAEKKNLKIIDIFDSDNKDFYLTDPGEFLYLIKNVQMVCTDSFHGCVFSILFHKEFICFDRIGSNAENMENRLSTLLQNFKLSNRMYAKWMAEGEPEINREHFDTVETVLANRRAEFNGYLDEIFDFKNR